MNSVPHIPANLRGDPLVPSDYEKLNSSWIDQRWADANLLRRVSSPEGAEIVGRRDNGSFGGVLFPNFWPDQNDVREYHLRRDRPEMVMGIDGKWKEHAKYLAPPGGGKKLYLPVPTHPDWLLDASLPLIITEGCKQLLALGRLAWHDPSDTAERPRFLAVGLYGVWNWRGTIGKENGPDGTRRDTKGPVADWERLVLEERKATIVYDSDVKSNPMVRGARTALTQYLLHQRGAQVFWATIPGPEKAKK
jgi:hypothetical protein